MPNVEKISIALPPEMVAVVRQAVETGEYASSSEVVRDALRDWTQKRNLRQQGIDELRQVWRQAMEDKTPDCSGQGCTGPSGTEIPRFGESGQIMRVEFLLPIRNCFDRAQPASLNSFHGSAF